MTRQAASITDVSATTRRAQPIDDIGQLESFLSYRVSILAKLLDRRLARLVGQRYGLALAEYRVLAQIIMRPKSTVRAVAARTFIDKAQVSRAVAVLEAQAFIARAVSGADRRSPVFTATRSGRALMNRIVPARWAQEQDLVDHLGRGEVAALSTTVASLIDLLADA